MVDPSGRNLAFILSTPRAGSTLLGAVLGSHSRVLCPPEPWLLLPLVAWRDDRQLVTAPYDAQLARTGVHELLDDELFDAGINAFVVTTYNRLLGRAGKQLLVDKTPRYYHILPSLDRLFPDSRQIWLQRSPLDVFASYKRTWQFDVADLRNEVPSPNCFDLTVGFLLLAAHFAGAPNKLIVRYEEFVADPLAGAQSLCAFLDLPFEEGMLNYGENRELVEAYRRARMGDKKIVESGQVHRGSVGRWREVLEWREVQDILLVLGTDLFRRLGYDHELDAALEYARLRPDDLAPEGKLPSFSRAYAEYGETILKSIAADPQLLRGVDVRYSVVAQQSALVGELERKQAVLEGLEAAVSELRSEVEEQVQERSTALAQKEREVRAALAEKEREVRAALAEKDREIGDRERLISERDQALVEKELMIASLNAVAGERQLIIERLEEYRRKGTLLARAEQGLRVGQERIRGGRERWSHFRSPRLGQLYQHPPRPIEIPPHYARVEPLAAPPSISIVTTSFNQGGFIERTIKSVLDQGYPSLEYVIQDGGSIDETPEILERYRERLAYTASEPDNGLAQGLNRGFRHATGEILAYLNSDDLLLPGALHYVARYLAEHPEVDVVYGHRVVIDENDAEVGRWVLPPHDDAVLTWADFVPQETLFWRRRVWEQVGASIDESFRFAVDWDLLLRFREAGATFARLPRFLGAFRAHPQQKTSAEMGEVGTREMARLRERCHGRPVTIDEINAATRWYLRQHIVHHKLYRLGVLRY